MMIEMTNNGNVRYIEIDGKMIGVMGMDGVIGEVEKLNIDYESDPGRLAEELLALGGVPGHVVLVVQRTYFASGRPVETADVVVPADRYRVSYHLPVK